MATFSQWAQRRRVSRLTWVCGPESVLREEVVAAVRAAESGEVIVMHADEHPEADVWSAAAQYPTGPGRLLVIRGAHRLRRWDRFPELAAVPELGSLLFVSEDTDFPKRDGVWAPHAAFIRDSRHGQVIKCVPPTGDALLDWLANRLPVGGRVLASHILAQAEDLDAAAAAAAKLTLVGQFTPETASLVTEEGGGDFADALVLGGAKPALQAALGAGREETGAAIGRLDWMLGILGLLHTALDERLGARDTSRKYGVKDFLYHRFRTAAPAYSPSRVARCQELLAMADSHWRSGAEGGILEAIALSW